MAKRMIIAALTAPMKPPSIAASLRRQPFLVANISNVMIKAKAHVVTAARSPTDSTPTISTRRRRR
jgi:hypothetical protein